jgi:hypothetical protein
MLLSSTSKTVIVSEDRSRESVSGEPNTWGAGEKWLRGEKRKLRKLLSYWLRRASARNEMVICSRNW